MADSHSNNENFAPPTAEDEEAAWILLSFKDNNNTRQAFINTSSAMSLDKETIQQDAEVRTLEHADAQGASVPTPASTSGTRSRLLISLSEQIVQKSKASKKPFTSRLTSDVATTSLETQRGIRERVIVNPDRTILAGRTEANLGQKGRKMAVNHTRRAINASSGGQNDAMDFDSHTHGNKAISSRSRVGSRRRTENVLPNRSIDLSPTPQQMAAEQGPLRLRMGEFPEASGETPAHKPSINPFTGAQTTTAQHFLQSTANPTTAGDDARRAHLNNANELARSLAVALPVNDYNGFDVIDGNAYAVIRGNGPAPPNPSHQLYEAGAAAAGASKCSAFRPVYIHTAKCDECNTRNRSVLYRCNTCSTQLDRACMTTNDEHGAYVNSLDWADHGAQSASKLRETVGPRVKKTRAKNVAAKKRVLVRDEAALEEQLVLSDEKDKKKKKEREANLLPKSTGGAFEDDGFMMLSPRIRIKREDKKARDPPPRRKPIRREAGAEKRKAEEAGLYEMSDDNAPKASKASRHPLATSSNGGGQSQQRAPAWPESVLSGFSAVSTQNPARSASSGGINSFFAEAGRLREEYTRVTEETESMKSRLAELQTEKDDIEAKIMKRMSN